MPLLRFSSCCERDPCDCKSTLWHDAIHRLRRTVAARVQCYGSQTIGEEDRSCGRAAADKLDDGPKAALTTAADTFEAQSSSKKFSLTFAEELSSAIKAFRKALAGADAELTAKQDEVLDALDSSCDSVINDNDESAVGRKWLSSNLPIFVLIDEYPELPGKQNIAQYLHRKQQGQLTDEDRCFEKLCKVADLDPAKLQQLLSKADAETRNQLVNRAGALVTKEIRRLWKDRALKVRFNIDGDYFETLVSDPNAVYEVEVNLEDRSRGFQWFFAFYIVFAADTQGLRRRRNLAPR